MLAKGNRYNINTWLIWELFLGLLTPHACHFRLINVGHHIGNQIFRLFSQQSNIKRVSEWMLTCTRFVDYWPTWSNKSWVQSGQTGQCCNSIYYTNQAVGKELKEAEEKIFKSWCVWIKGDMRAVKAFPMCWGGLQLLESNVTGMKTCKGIIIHKMARTRKL